MKESGRMHGSTWQDQLSWVQRHSPLTKAALSRFPARPDVELYLCFHLDLKMIPVISRLAQKVPLKVIACNRETVDPLGWEELSGCQGLELLDRDLAFRRLSTRAKAARYLCDLGGELICQGLAYPGAAVAALEGTTSGLSRIQSYLGSATPAIPILDWNSAPLKLAVHNEKMVGFSLWQTFTEVTRLSLHGKSVGVLGFGAVGRGIARTARNLGGTVSIHDPSAEARTLAAFEGFRVPGREVLLCESDVLVTATGRDSAISDMDLPKLREGVFLANAGHSCDEIAAEIREHHCRRQVLRHVEEITTESGRHCFLLARGEMVNLGAGFGDTINGFDLTSAQLIQAVRYLLENGARLAPGWHELPRDFVTEVLS